MNGLSKRKQINILELQNASRPYTKQQVKVRTRSGHQRLQSLGEMPSDERLAKRKQHTARKGTLKVITQENEILLFETVRGFQRLCGLFEPKGSQTLGFDSWPQSEGRAMHSGERSSNGRD